MSDNPLVSVIMPVFNGETFLKESIQSILNQTYKNFEFIIINDGSTDTSASILSHFTNKDNRIKIYTFLDNAGVVRCLNKGIELSQGKYIARMDADDISLPNRLKKQVLFLEQNPKYYLIGSQTEMINQKGKQLGVFTQLYSSYEELKISSLFYSPFSHPTIMIKKEFLNSTSYHSDFHKIEDYDLWIRLLENNFASNLNETLLLYRIHPGQETQNENNIRVSNLKKLYRRQFKLYGISFSEIDLETHLLIPGSNAIQLSLEQIKELDIWLQKLHNQLLNINRFENKYLNNIFKRVWRDICLKGKQNGYRTYFIFKKGKFYTNKENKGLLFYFFSHRYFSFLHSIYFKLRPISK